MDAPAAVVPTGRGAPAKFRPGNSASAERQSASQPGLSTVRAALRRAVRAPSLHNSQPWRWRRGHAGLDLLSDDSRWLAAADPDRTDLLISCGAMLHHARVAFAALDWSTIVRRVPDPQEPTHLASLTFAREPASPDLAALAEAITRRYSNRSPYTSWEIPEGIVRILLRSGSDQGATVARVEDGTVYRDLAIALAEAESARQANQGYRDELALWTGAPIIQRAGVPESSFRPPTHPVNRPPFNRTSGGEAPVAREDDASVFLVIGTVHDDDESRLRAGEAVSAILLEATAIGLATCPISLPAEAPGIRRLLRSVVFGDGSYPHLIVRVGWAHVHHQRPPATPRLAVDSIFDSEEHRERTAKRCSGARPGRSHPVGDR